MTTGKLFISFWDICLDNLPEGSFRRRHLLPDEANRCIEEARQAGTLVGVSDEDLLAPYRQRESENHEALCRALHAHFDIALSRRDFCVQDGETEDTLYFTRALNFAEVREEDRLMVVTCNYLLHGKGDSQDLARFTIAPDSVDFHLIEAA